MSLLNCCPVLQNLSLQTTKWDNNDTSKIIVPTLKRLRLSRFTLHKYDKLEINAPALEYLYFRGYMIEQILLGNLSNLVEAAVRVDSDESEDNGNRG